MTSDEDAMEAAAQIAEILKNRPYLAQHEQLEEEETPKNKVFELVVLAPGQRPPPDVPHVTLADLGSTPELEREDNDAMVRCAVHTIFCVGTDASNTYDAALGDEKTTTIFRGVLAGVTQVPSEVHKAVHAKNVLMGVEHDAPHCLVVESRSPVLVHVCATGALARLDDAVEFTVEDLT